MEEIHEIDTDQVLFLSKRTLVSENITPDGSNTFIMLQK